MRTVLKVLIWVFVGACALYACVCVLVYTKQASFIYFPDSRSLDNCQLTDVKLVTHGGTRLLVHEQTKEWVVFYHGNAGNACDRQAISDIFKQANLSYILVEYAGYAGDTQTPSQYLLQTNVEDAQQYLASRNIHSYTIAGESLGTSMAAYHSSLAPDQKVILISPFYSLAHVAHRTFPWLPTGLIIKDEFPSYTWLQNSRTVRILHSQTDEVIPLASAKKLFESIQTQDKQFVEIHNTGHNETYQNPEGVNAIKNFFSK